MQEIVDELAEEDENLDVESEENEEGLESELTEEIDEELADEEDEDDEEEFVEATKRARKEKEDFEDEDIVEERFYTIPLRKAWISPRKKRAPKATRIIKKFVLKHMKVRTEPDEEEEPERLVIDNEVNEKIWERGIEKPPRKIRVKVIKDKEGVVTVLLAEGD